MCLGCVLKVLLRGWYPAWNTSSPPPPPIKTYHFQHRAIPAKNMRIEKGQNLCGVCGCECMFQTGWALSHSCQCQCQCQWLDFIWNSFPDFIADQTNAIKGWISVWPGWWNFGSCQALLQMLKKYVKLTHFSTFGMISVPQPTAITTSPGRKQSWICRWVFSHKTHKVQRQIQEFSIGVHKHTFHADKRQCLGTHTQSGALSRALARTRHARHFDRQLSFWWATFVFDRLDKNKMTA